LKIVERYLSAPWGFSSVKADRQKRSSSELKKKRLWFYKNLKKLLPRKGVKNYEE